MDTESRLNEMHADLCKVFTSPTRVQILMLLRHGEKTVRELADEVEIPQPNVSQHLAVMRARGILTVRKEGTTAHYRLSNPKVLKAFDIIREVIHENLQQGARITKGAR